MDLRVLDASRRRPWRPSAIAVRRDCPRLAGRAGEAVAGSTAPSPTPASRRASCPPTPEGFEVSAREAVEIANADPKVAEETRRVRRALTTAIEANDDSVWQVGYTADGTRGRPGEGRPHSGAVTETWTGYQVAWPMARGYEGQFGHVLNAPYVWIPMALIFLAGLFDFRRPAAHRPPRPAGPALVRRLAVLLQRRRRSASPSRSPTRRSSTCSSACSGSASAGGRGTAPVAAGTRGSALAAVVLIAFRVTVNIADSGVIDVGYAGTIGADKITHGEPIYGEGEFPDDNRFGDTYGPVNYYAYVPFELGAAVGRRPGTSSRPRTRAAITFDLATSPGCSSAASGCARAAAAASSGSCSASPGSPTPTRTSPCSRTPTTRWSAALLVWSLALFASPVARGALLALAAMAKFAPLGAGAALRRGDPAC